MARETVSIYLAGKVPKGGDVETAKDWRRQYIDELSRAGNFSFLSPEDPSLDESRPMEVFGHDCHLVKSCDVLLVDAREKLGVGTAQEMLIAKYYGKAVVTILPRDSHHRRTDFLMHGRLIEDWIHPFIACTSDAIYGSLEELCKAVSLEGNLAVQDIKTLGVVDEAIAQYLDSSHASSRNV